MNRQEQFSERVKKARLYAGYSQKRVALALGCNAKTIARWEDGSTTKPAPGLFREFATLTHSDIAWLYEGGARNGGAGEDHSDS